MIWAVSWVTLDGISFILNNSDTSLIHSALLVVRFRDCLLLTSWIASPISHIWTSMPAALMPVLVASFTAARRGSNFGSKATVHAQSMMRPAGRGYGWDVVRDGMWGGELQGYRVGWKDDWRGLRDSDKWDQCPLMNRWQGVQSDSLFVLFVRYRVHVLTVNLCAEVDLHHVSVLQHCVVSAVRGVVGRHMVHRAAGGKPDSSLKTVKKNNGECCE